MADIHLCECGCGRQTLPYKCTKTSEGIVKGEPSRRLKGHTRAYGLKHRPEYRAWCCIKSRCTNPSVKSWKYYGGKGVHLYAEWSKSFESFLSYVGQKPGPGYSIDRYPNNDGNYEPGNVRWATAKQQVSNRSNTVRITHNGMTKTAADWARFLNISYRTIIHRLRRGLSPQEVLSTKVLRKPKTHCPHGHSYDGMYNGIHTCTQCRKEASRRFYLKTLIGDLQ